MEFALVCLDNQHIAKHFRQGRWVEIGDYCDPFDLCDQLEKVGKMMGGDVEQRTGKSDTNNFLKTIGEQVMLYYYRDLESRWKAYSVYRDKRKLKKHIYGCIAPWLLRVAMRPLQQHFATALHQGETVDPKS